MHFLVIVLAVATLLTGSMRSPASAEMTAKLSDEQATQLHEAVCSEPVRRAHEYGREIWVCDHPRAYPHETDSYFCPANILDFSFSGDSFDIFFGRFTMDRPQAVAMYRASCEPHANSFGGMALFDVVDQKFEFVRYYPGLRAVDCVVPPFQSNERQTAYCYRRFTAQGFSTYGFGPIRFKPSGEATFDTWFDAENGDASLGPMTACKTNKSKPHHISALWFDEAKSEIVLDVAVLDPRSVASACIRKRRRDFNEREKELREWSIVARGMAFIREDELQFVRMTVRFRPPSARPRTKLIAEPAEP